MCHLVLAVACGVTCRDLELRQFNGQAGHEAVLPLLEQAEAALREELRQWVGTLQQARNTYPHLCSVPTRQIWVLAEAFTGDTSHKAAFLDLMRGLSCNIPLTDELLSGLPPDNGEADHHATVLAVGARVQEIMAAHPPPPPRQVTGLRARHFKRALTSSQAAKARAGAAAVAADAGVEEAKGAGGAAAATGSDAVVQPPRVLNGSVKLVSTPTQQVRAVRGCA